MSDVLPSHFVCVYGGKITLCYLLKINESRYIALFVVSGSIKKLFSIDYVTIYLFSIFSK